MPGYEAYDHKQMAKMTHLEPFKYPVWDRNLWTQVHAGDGESCLDGGSFSEGGSCPEIETFILFDYSQRDPLTGDARTTDL